MRVVFFVSGSVRACAFSIAFHADVTRGSLRSHEVLPLACYRALSGNAPPIQHAVVARRENGPLSAGELTTEESLECCQNTRRVFRTDADQEKKASSSQTRRRTQRTLPWSGPSSTAPEPLVRHSHGDGPAWRALYGRGRRAGAADLEGKAGCLGKEN